MTKLIGDILPKSLEEHEGETDPHTQYILADGTRDFTGSQNTQNLIPVADKTHDLGSQSLLYRRVLGQLGVFVSDGGTVELPTNTTHGGLLFGTQGGNGSRTHRLNGGSYPAAMCGGTSFAATGSTATVEATAGGAFTLGSAYTSAAGASATMQATAFSAVAMGYAYGRGTSLVSASGSSAVCFGYAWARRTGTATVQSTGSGAFCSGKTRSHTDTATTLLQSTGYGSFAQGYVRTNGTVASSSTLQATGSGTFAQGYVLSSGLGGDCLIDAIGLGAFAQGNTRSESTGNTEISAYGKGSFAQGTAHSTGATNVKVEAYGDGAFAHGHAHNASIIASANNSAQFGVGTNAQADSLQVGNAGLRINGLAGAPAGLQNGDMWVNGGYVYIRSNGVSCKVTNAVL